MIHCASHSQDVVSNSTVLISRSLCNVLLPTTNFVDLFMDSSLVAVGFSANQQFLRRQLLRGHEGAGKLSNRRENRAAWSKGWKGTVAGR
jgi:hypothetical protein